MYPLGQREYPQGEGLETKYKIILNLIALDYLLLSSDYKGN
ncbi:MAG: hypothetical protein Q8S84_09100 [bacterium]|nr:hypothetical protein [bacterium]